MSAGGMHMTYEPCTLVLFGATGHLAQTKLYPALHNLYLEGLLPEGLTVVGVGRRLANKEELQQEVARAVAIHSRGDKEVSEDFLSLFHYLQFDLNHEEGFKLLRNHLMRYNHRRFLFYLAIAPASFPIAVEQLQKAGLTKSAGTWPRIAVEKPFGRDLDSAQSLNSKLKASFPADNIYRIDHYLGKEMLQNILVLRFANSLFEPLWNNRYLRKIQLNVLESGSVADRGSYFEQAGALRDMIPSHLMQLLALLAMEPPASLTQEAIASEKVKVLRSLSPLKNENILRGQYVEGELGGKKVPGYRQEPGVSPNSEVETFVSLRLFVNNFRWAQVPFLITTGKRLPQEGAGVIVEFKTPPQVLYFDKYDLEPNLLVIKIQPQEGVFLQFNAKKLASKEQIVPVQMDYCQNCAFPNLSPRAYEHLLRDIFLGDGALFASWEEIETAWEFYDQVLSLSDLGKLPLKPYRAGSWPPVPWLEEDLCKSTIFPCPSQN